MRICIWSRGSNFIACMPESDKQEDGREINTHLFVTENRSYEDIEYEEGLGWIPYGRTDFYGHRRYFYYLLDKELRRIGK